MNYPIGATGQDGDVQIVDDNGLPVLGLVAAAFPSVFFSASGQNAASVAIALQDLPLITSSWQSGGIKERSGGYYRFCFPDAMFAALSQVRVFGEITGKHLICPPLQVGVVPSNAPGGTACEIFVNEGGIPVQAAAVWLTSDAGGAIIVAGVNYSDSDGLVTFYLDVGATYYLWVRKDGITPVLGVPYIASAG